MIAHIIVLIEIQHIIRGLCLEAGADKRYNIEDYTDSGDLAQQSPYHRFTMWSGNEKAILLLISLFVAEMLNPIA